MSEGLMGIIDKLRGKDREPKPGDLYVAHVVDRSSEPGRPIVRESYSVLVSNGPDKEYPDHYSFTSLASDVKWADHIPSDVRAMHAYDQEIPDGEDGLIPWRMLGMFGYDSHGKGYSYGKGGEIFGSGKFTKITQDDPAKLQGALAFMTEQSETQNPSEGEIDPEVLKRVGNLFDTKLARYPKVKEALKANLLPSAPSPK